VEDAQHVAEIRPIGITAIVSTVREELKKQYESAPLVSLLVLWLRRNMGINNEGKLGTLVRRPIAPGTTPKRGKFESWEGRAISWYLKRRCPDKPNPA
jgi:hypothetical protein